MRFFFACSLSLLALATTGCAVDLGHGCGLVGCRDGLVVSIAPRVGGTVAPGDYVFDLTIDGATSHATCHVAAPNHPSTCDDPRIAAVIGDGGSDAFIVTLDGTPTSVTIAATTPDGHTTTGSWTPSYQDFAPNGVACGPICHEASAEMNA